MSFSLYDKGDIVRREASLNSLLNDPALNKIEPVSTKNQKIDSSLNESDFANKQSAARAYAENAGLGDDRAGLIKADEIMSSPVETIEPSLAIELAHSVFIEKRFRHLLIQSGSQLRGIISERDILRMLNGSPQAPVCYFMREAVLTAKPHTTIRDLARVMFHERIGALPILEADHDLAGIVTRSDILRALVNKGSVEIWG